MEEFSTALQMQDVKEGKVIMHLDLDAFFAACEEVRNPRLKGKPVVIGADPKQGKGRGVVSTANYDARKYGIKSVMPISWAYRRCPKAIFLKPDFNLYSETSERIFSWLEKEGDKFEQGGIDECYLDLTSKGFDGAEKFGYEIKRKLLQKEKLTCSIGIASNKMIAKIASDFKKPNGLTIVKPQEIKMFLSNMNVEKIPGIGPKTAAKLNNLGIVKVKELNKFGEEKLKEKFGENWGSWLFRKSQGIGSANVGAVWERKSLGAERTFYEDVSDKNKIFDMLEKICEKIFQRANKKGFEFRKVTVKLRYEDFETFTRQKSAKEKIAYLEKLSDVSKTLIKPFLDSKKKIRLIGVRLS